MNLKKSFFRRGAFFTLYLIAASYAMAQTISKVQYFDLKDVELQDSPFRHAQELDKKYLLEMNADRLLAPFMREAGLIPKAESYANWESTGLDGHIGGHYLSALSLMYASTGDQQIKQRLDYMVKELKHVQDANGNGYIGGVPNGKKIWDEIAEGNIRAGGFDLNGRWAPLYNVHKTYAGLRDAYLYAGNEDAMEMLIKMTDWMIQLTSNLTEKQIQKILHCEHGGLNEVFADVAVITGDKKYLDLAYQFSHQNILNPLLNREDKLTGMHGNTQIPKVIGFKRIADAGENGDWSEASRFFWEVVVRDRSVCIGGNTVSEHFNPVNDFSRMISGIEGPETCNSYNMLRLTKMLHQTSLDKRYIDYYERALYNHILSTQHPETGGLVYFTQMRPGHYRVYSRPGSSMWCCVGTGIENHAKYGEMIYAYTQDELYVNLFIPSKLNWEEKQVEITQNNNFPEESQTTITVNPKKKAVFTLKLRYPAWVKEGALKVWLNGDPFPISTSTDGYVAINRKWKKGDKVTMEMPMHVTIEQLPDKSNYYAFFYGPIVLAAKTGTEDLKGLFDDDSRGGHIAHGKRIPLKDIPIIVGQPNALPTLLQPVNGKPLTFSLSSLYPENTAFELMPFYKVHESRYIIYWPQATVNEVEEMQRKIEQEEQERAQLDAKTIDKIVGGQQQPESDHFVKYENSETGFTDDTHWREAKGWFSYELKNSDKNAKQLYLKYFNRSWERKSEIYINGQKLTELEVGNGSNEELLVNTYQIPESEQKKEVLTVKFIAKPEFIVPRIAEVRLLK